MSYWHDFVTSDPCELKTAVNAYIKAKFTYSHIEEKNEHRKMRSNG
jgi:type IV secretory pathway component VirB8